jgi:hypothetical protein
MPNKRGQGLKLNDFEPRGALAGNLPNVPRAGGEEAEALSAITNRLAQRFGGIADEQAVIEGQKAGTVEGVRPGFRPSGMTTLRGQAYDKAGAQSYLDQLDANLRSDMQGVFEAEENRRDPAKLTAALEGVKATYDREHVFPEIQGRFSKKFADLSFAYRNKAVENFESDRKDREAADAVVRLNDSQTTAKRQLVSVDPDTPGAETIVRGGIAEREGVARRAAASGAITEKAAEVQIINDRRQTLVDFELAKARKLKTPAEIAAYRTEARKRFGEGKIPGLDGDGAEVLDTQLQRLETQAGTQGRTVDGAVRRSLDDYVKRVAAGDRPRPEEWTQILTAAKAAPGGDGLIETASAKVRIAEAVRDRPIAQGRAFVEAERAKLNAAGGTTPGQAELLNYMDELLNEQGKALREDQIGLAARKGVVPQATVLDLPAYGQQAGPEAVAGLTGQFRARAAQARAVGQTFGVQPQFLRPAEKEALADLARQGGDKALGVAQAIVAGAGPDAPAVLREIGENAPLLAQAGVIVASGASRAAARDALEAARIKLEAGKDLPSVPAPILAKARQTVLSEAYQDIPDEKERVATTAQAIARVRLDREGIDPKTNPKEAERIVTRAYQEAAGAVFEGGVQYGGLAPYQVRERNWFGLGGEAARTVVPAGVRADRFRDVVKAIRDEDLAALPVPPVDATGKPYRARDLHAARPVAVAGGYRFVLGGVSGQEKWIRGQDGQPFTLPFEQLQPELRRRVPGAFFGGQN